MITLQNKTVVITGASSGFGAAIAFKCAERGAKVFLGARRVQRLEKLSAHIQSQVQNTARYHLLDVTDAASVEVFCQFVAEHTPTIDVLINNAGLGLGRDAIENAHTADWLTMYETNVMGVLHMTQKILPTMLKQGYGHILNIGSIAGHEIYEGGAGYCGTKFALRALTKTLRQETFGKNIRVTSIDPGMAETEFSEVRFGGDKEKARAVYHGMKPLAADDIAESVIFALAQPAHVNIDEILLTPTAQVSASRVFRK